MSDSIVNLEHAFKLGLSQSDFEEIQKILNRNPSRIEAFIFSKLWSDSPENKYSIEIDSLEKKIKKLLDESGIMQSDSIEIDKELSCVLKIESVLSANPKDIYNESALNTINLYRDLISQNAKIIASVNSFQFSNQNLEASKTLLTEFIKGSSSYSNAFGAPVVGIQTCFNECNLKPVLNSFLIGIKKTEKNKALKIPKPNCKILIIKPESDCIINSSMYEKLIHETILEAFEENLITELQAITNLSFLDSCLGLISKTELGLQISIDQVDEVNSIEEIEKVLNSNSVSSFLIVCDEESCTELKNLITDSGINYAEIGKLIENKHLIISNKSQVIADLPVNSVQKRIKAGEEFVVKNFPLQKAVEFDINQIPAQKNLREIAWFLIKHLNIVSKKWIFEQYDSMVGVSNMSTNFPSSAALVNLKENDSALAISLEINSMYFKANPEIGIQIAVAEAARKIVCTGAKPIGITAGFSFLNNNGIFDNEKFTYSLNGLIKACKQFKTQLSSIKMKAFEVDKQEINQPNCSMPIIGMFGILKDKNHQMTISFKNKGNIIFLIGHSKEDISSSEYLYSYHQVKNSPTPWFNLALEHKTQCAVQELIEKNYVCSVHSVSKGGIFISLVESAMRFGLGFDIITDTDIRTDAFLFGESQGRIIVSITPNKEDHFIDFMLKKEVPFLALGHVTKGEMRVDDISFGFIEDAKREYENTFEKLIGK